MNLFATIFYDWSRLIADRFAWAGPLAVRVVVGWVFLTTGWTKLTILPRMTEMFRSWGIPAPEVLTPFVSGMEFVGGVLLLVGLLTRFIAVPMMVIMLVAIAAVKWADVDSVATLLGFEEVSYFVMFAWLAIAGPGPVSLDHFIVRWLRPTRLSSDYGA
jgi:putative oxidoreductase